MNLTRYLKTDYLPIPLIATMILTRFHHFGDVLHLPDASLAVFFFAGFYRNKLFLVFLLSLAGLIDYVAIANGTSDWCISPAYVFLIPTYAVMWFTGRCCLNLATNKGSEVRLSFDTLGLLALATTVAFMISNGSFYLFSGRYETMSLMTYASRTAQYYLPYLSSTLIYSLVGYGAIKFIKLLVVLQDKQKTI